MDWFTDPSIWMAFVTLTAQEIVLGIDNIVFVTILEGTLPNLVRLEGGVRGSTRGSGRTGPGAPESNSSSLQPRPRAPDGCRRSWIIA